jgi:hypothetical protein
MPEVFSATEKVRFQQKAMGIPAILEGTLMLTSVSYHVFQAG